MKAYTCDHRAMEGLQYAADALSAPGAGLGRQQSAIAHDDARLILDRDPHLESEWGRALRTLLYLFRPTRPSNTCAPADFP